MIIQGIL